VKLVVSKATLRVLLLAIILGALLTAAISAIPDGATVAVGKPQTKNVSAPQNVTAQGGNITEVNITDNTQTQVWQGFWGTVNGSIVLQDAAAATFYRWNVFNISGEVYASRLSSVNFANIKPDNNCSDDNSLTGFGFSDSVNNTYTNNTNRFIQVGTVAINASTACAVYTFVNSSAQSSFFQDIILTDTLNTNITNGSTSVGGNTTVYATPIEGNISGYNGLNRTGLVGTYQLLVPVNRTAGFNTYFFYAEIG